MSREITAHKSQANYAAVLKDRYPDFRYTRALYLDFEGTGKTEFILSVWWPQNAGPDRFAWIRRQGNEKSLSPDAFSEIESHVADKRNALESIVVFSGEADMEHSNLPPGSPDEQVRMRRWLGREPFPDAQWVNLHDPLRQKGDAKLTRKRIKERAMVEVAKTKKIIARLDPDPKFRRRASGLIL